MRHVDADAEADAMRGKWDYYRALPDFNQHYPGFYPWIYSS